ncbi:MAG: hypothetical protein C0179_03985 [Fervidicoccus sp.]|nr:MAG: hypothetical protein C0179_03985 [Fervidicoccus sp.]
MLPVCRTAVFRCASRKPLYNIFFSVAETGSSIGGCFLSFVSPSPCLLTPDTNIVYGEYFDLRVEEFDNNIELQITYSSNKELRTYYVYPRNVWERINGYIESFREKGYPEEPALILIGPPGTGKSSMLSILADYLGFYRVSVDPESILSMWLGETEKKFFAAFAEAETNIPSIMLFDEAEWIISSSHAGGTRSEASVHVYVNMKNILKRKIDEFGKKKLPILAVFATNLSEEDIADTMMRSGRAYRPVFVPLPDFSAIRRIIERYFPEFSSEADKLATSMINAGLSMADVFRVLGDYKRTGRLKIEEMRSRGYSRMMISPRLLEDRDVIQYLQNLSDKIDPDIFRFRRLRIWIENTFEAVMPIITAFIIYKARKPVIALTDARYLDECMSTVRSTDGILLVNYNNVFRDALSTLSGQNIPIILIGTVSGYDERPKGYHRLAVDFFEIKPRTAPVKIIANILNIDIDQAKIQKMGLDAKSSAEYKAFIETLATTGSTKLSSL